MNYTCITPTNEQEFKAYYRLRWQILRKPWHQELGSERDELENQACHRMVVDENNQVVAVGRLHQTAQFSGQIRYMAVAEEHQGNGLGQVLLADLENQAQHLGVNEISLNAREAAKPFYQKLGYQEQGFSHLLFDEIKHFSFTKKLESLPDHKSDLSRQLQQTWHNTIPLSKAMNIAIAHYNGELLTTHCDLKFNKNLHNTMFAGSVYTLATLSGWGWVYLQMAEGNVSGDIVLADAQIKYHKPLAGAGFAKVDKNQVEGSVEPLQTNKKAKFKLTVNVCCGDTLAATFTGLYVVIPKK